MTVDLAVTDTWLVTMRGDGPDGVEDGPGVVEDGAVGIVDGEITYVGSANGFDASAADRVIDGSGRVTLPGLVDAHAHTGLTLLRGTAQDVPEIEWMNRALGPLADRVTSEDRIAGARLGVVEALRSGVTTVGEYARDVGDLVESVYEPLGVRVAPAETINAVVDRREDAGPREPYVFDAEKGERGLGRADALLDRYGDADRVHPMYGPQALDMVPLDLLERIDDRARERDATLHVHVAQGRRERLQIEGRFGADASTVSVLDDHDLLGPRLLAAHCHGATPAERERLADSGARFVGCPSSIAAIDGVVPPVAEFRGYGAPVGIGTDQAPGPGGHDMPREVRTAAMLAKADAGDPTALPAWAALATATRGGAAALDLPVGRLAEGAPADLAVVDVTDPGVAPVVPGPPRTLVPNLVYAGTRATVETVVVDGEVLVDEGEVLGVDTDAVVAEANERAERIVAEAEADWRAAGSKLVTDSDDGLL